MQNLFLPVNMIRLLQHVDSSEGRFFKAAYRHLLTQHILDNIKGHDDDTNRKFNLRNFVTVCDGVLSMAKIWEISSKNMD